MTKECDKAENKDAVYYDGSCPMCVAIVGKIDESSNAEKFSMKDITKEKLCQSHAVHRDGDRHTIATPRVRANSSPMFALAMCGLVLWTLGPLGHNWDNIVWPWNITLALSVVLLFATGRTNPIRGMFVVGNYAAQKALLLLFGVLPLLWFFNVWDSYWSWSLYSGRTNIADIYVSDGVLTQLPDSVQRLMKTDDRHRNFVPVVDLAFAELNVPPYPEARVFKNVARRFCDLAVEPQDVLLVMRGRLSWFYRDAPQVLNCAQLQPLPMSALRQ